MLPPFRPAVALGGFHRQTLFGAMLRRASERGAAMSELHELQPSAELRVRLHVDPVPGVSRGPAVLLVHGMGGNSSSSYVQRAARLARARGVLSARIDLRGAAGCEALSPWLAHAGQTEDVRTAVEFLLADPRVESLTLAGFSMGGNIVLKLGSEWAGGAPSRVRALVGVSAAVDLMLAGRAIDSSPGLGFYRHLFVQEMKRHARVRAQLRGASPWTAAVERAHTLEDVDAAAICAVYGFDDPAQYRRSQSALPHLRKLQVPSLALHADDDRLVPCAEVLRAAASESPALSVAITRGGGHCAFVGRTNAGWRFYAEEIIAQVAAGEIHLGSAPSAGSGQALAGAPHR